jgi:hypothetical protein
MVPVMLHTWIMQYACRIETVRLPPTVPVNSDRAVLAEKPSSHSILHVVQVQLVGEERVAVEFEVVGGGNRRPGCLY